MHVAFKYILAAQRILADQIYHRALGHRRPIIYRQAVGSNSVALTFDDGPSPESTPFLLHELKRAGGKATFFLSGVRVAAYPRLVADIVAAGHAVYGHGWEHVDLEQAGPAAAIAAAERVEALLSALRPTPTPYLIRFPYNAGYQRGWMHLAMQKFHPDVRFASWSFSTRDWLLADGCDNLNAIADRCDVVAERLVALSDLRRTIVLLHEDPFGASGRLSASVAKILLPAIIDRISHRGLRLDVIQTEPEQGSNGIAK